MQRLTSLPPQAPQQNQKIQLRLRREDDLREEQVSDKDKASELIEFCRTNPRFEEAAFDEQDSNWGLLRRVSKELAISPREQEILEGLYQFMLQVKRKPGRLA